MFAPDLPYEVCELILERTHNLQDASHLAQSSPMFYHVWLNAVSRRRICEAIAIDRVPNLEQAKKLADIQMGPLARFKPELAFVTEKVTRVLDISRQAAFAAELFEAGALRCLPRCESPKRTSSQSTLADVSPASDPNDEHKPHYLLPAERERFLTTYLQQWTIACTSSIERLALIRSLPKNELLRLEDLAYWLASLSARERESLQHDTQAWKSAFQALHERDRYTVGNISTHWIFLNSQRRQMAAFQALIDGDYDLSAGFVRTVSIGAAGGGITAA